MGRWHLGSSRQLRPSAAAPSPPSLAALPQLLAHPLPLRLAELAGVAPRCLLEVDLLQLRCHLRHPDFHT